MGPTADRSVVVIILGGFLVWVVWGWSSWVRGRPAQLSDGMGCSLVAFIMGSASVGIEIATGTYAQFINGFPFEDPVLLGIYRCGFLVALVGLFISLFGITTKSPLRWKAPALSFVLLLLWVAQAMGE